MAKVAKKAIKEVAEETEFVEVRFIKSPFGKFNLPYYIGQKVSLKKDLADILRKDGFIE